MILTYVRVMGNVSVLVCVVPHELKARVVAHAAAAGAGAERDVVLVDSEHHKCRRARWSRSYVRTDAKGLHQVPDAGQSLSLCLWRTVVWSGRVWLDAAHW